MQITYDKAQFDAAVNYVWAYNHHTKNETRDKCEAFLMRLITSNAPRQVTFVACGGFTIVFTADPDDTNLVEVDITVEPTFKDCDIRTLEI